LAVYLFRIKGACSMGMLLRRHRQKNEEVKPEPKKEQKAPKKQSKKKAE
jgi:hypothetical protein